MIQYTVGMGRIAGIVVAAVLIALPVSAATRLLTGAVVHGPSGPERAAVLIRDGRIAAVVDPMAADRLIGEVDGLEALPGCHIVPGLIDAHLHLAGYGAALEQVDCAGLTSWEACVGRAAARARELPAGAWVLGRGWDQNLWHGKAFPGREELDRRIPDRPVLLRRVDGHAAVANAAALEAAGIGPDTPDPPGGRLGRRKDGTLSGLLVDGAVELVRRAVPPPDAAVIERWILRSARALAARGLTQIGDAGTTAAELEVLLRLEREGRLPIRIWVMLDGTDDALLARWFARGPLKTPGRMVRVGSVKLYADGALGSRGALLGADYTDDPGNRGLAVTPLGRLRKVTMEASAAGFQVAVHAIGDEAVHRVLDVFEAVGPARCRRLRHRIEHAQTVRPEDVARFARLGVTASVQPLHCIDDMPWAPDRLGPERILWAYRWRSLLDAGVALAGGSDAPVASPDPLAGMLAAVTRQRPDGTPAGGWNPAERLTAGEALHLFTDWAARASFSEGWCGAVAPGMAADLTVLDGDPLANGGRGAGRVRVERTVVDGIDRFVAGEPR